MPPPLEIALAEIDRNLHMEQELFAMAEEVAIEVNAEIPPADPMSFLPGPSIRREEDTPKFRFGSRFLEIRFFSRRNIYSTYPQAASQMEILWQHYVAYGGSIEIFEEGAQREGWNLILLRPPDSLYGRWLIVETREAQFFSMRPYAEPFAVGPEALGRILAYHWDPKTEPVKVTDKLLERGDLVKIFHVLIA